ncbi:hypothetical protein K432DRAFT_312627, partial [Lepidopterella palustris CBS 459.81]
MATPTLPELPAELISQIAQYLFKGPTELYGVYGLRLTCRALREKTRWEFSKAAFSTLNVDFYPESLKRLGTICQHHEFCKAVKRIYFAHDEQQTISLGKIDEEVRTTVSEKVQPVIIRVLTDSFKRLPNVSDIVIIAPFVARFLQY